MNTPNCRVVISVRFKLSDYLAGLGFEYLTDCYEIVLTSFVMRRCSYYKLLLKGIPKPNAIDFGMSSDHNESRIQRLLNDFPLKGESLQLSQVRDVYHFLNFSNVS
jgi:hypothetical protein